VKLTLYVSAFFRKDPSGHLQLTQMRISIICNVVYVLRKSLQKPRAYCLRPGTNICKTSLIL